MTTPPTRRRRTLLEASKFNAMSLAIIAVAALQISTVYAQTPAPAKPAAPSADTARYMEAFERADKNADGKLSKEEAENLPAIAQRFEQIDTDKDGSISKAEYLEALKP
jgi:Ca2+-binding EF-hand superfamily protein